MSADDAMRELVALGDEVGMTGAELISIMWCDDVAAIVKHTAIRRRVRAMLKAHGDVIAVLIRLTLAADSTEDNFND